MGSPGAGVDQDQRRRSNRQLYGCRRHRYGGSRPCAGLFLSSRCVKYDGITDPLSLEILACRDRMLLAREKGYNSVIIETDCLNAKSMWEARLEGRSIGYHILHEMQTELPSF